MKDKLLAKLADMESREIVQIAFRLMVRLSEPLILITPKSDFDGGYPPDHYHTLFSLAYRTGRN